MWVSRLQTNKTLLFIEYVKIDSKTILFNYEGSCTIRRP